MSADARGMAWLRAEAILEAAQKVAAPNGDVTPPLHEWYWGLLAQADIWARLAQVFDVVAFGVGDYIAERERRDADEKARLAELRAKFRHEHGADAEQTA